MKYYSVLVLLVVVLIVGIVWYIRATSPEYGKFDLVAVTIKEVPGKNIKELVDQKLVFTDKQGVEWTAIQGTWTDGASIPQLALGITNDRFQEEFLKAAIVHDAYCQDINETRCRNQYRSRTHRQTHLMFYEACLACGTGPVKAKVMYMAVRLCGPTWGNPGENLSKVSNDVAQISYAGCQKWIETNNPDIKKIDQWIDERVPVVIELVTVQNEVITAIEKGNLGNRSHPG